MVDMDDYNEMLEYEAKEHEKFLASMMVHSRNGDLALVGDKYSRRYVKPRWYKVRQNSIGKEFVLWRGRRLYLDEIGG